MCGTPAEPTLAWGYSLPEAWLLPPEKNWLRLSGCQVEEYPFGNGNPNRNHDLKR